MKRIITLLGALTGLAVVSLYAQSSSPTSSSSTATAAHHTVFKADDLKWGDGPPALPRGAKLAVLAGDPGAAGHFTVRLKMPAGYKIPLHTHPTDELVTILSGSPEFKAGSADAKPEKLTAGAFLVMPAGMQHGVTATTETIVQVSAEGPFVVNYVNPADDPRTAK
jgi:quercetin dioxygenase-like cupin family protein